MLDKPFDGEGTPFAVEDAAANRVVREEVDATIAVEFAEDQRRCPFHAPIRPFLREWDDVFLIDVADERRGVGDLDAKLSRARFWPEGCDLHRGDAGFIEDCLIALLKRLQRNGCLRARRDDAVHRLIVRCVPCLDVRINR